MSTPTIPILDLAPEIDFLWDDLNTAFQRVMRSGVFIGGPEVEAFEHEVASFLGVKHAVGVNSGTDALLIAVKALGIGAGDEVITTPFSFFATAESIMNAGATPVFVDIDARTFNIDPTLIEAAITPRTKAIMPVHLYGRPCDMHAIMSIADKHNLLVIEDCAQAFGATTLGKRVGTIGHTGAFSFFPTKNLGGFGDGGMLVTNDDNVALTARKLRSHGSIKKYQNEMLGFNSRLDALQAAFLRVKLPFVDAWNDQRREVARRYDLHLRNVPGLVVPEIVDGHVFHQYTVRVLDRKRDVVADRLAERGIQTMVYYPTPQDLLPVFHPSPEPRAASQDTANEVLSLPIGPILPAGQQNQVIDAIRT